MATARRAISISPGIKVWCPLEPTYLVGRKGQTNLTLNGIGLCCTQASIRRPPNDTAAPRVPEPRSAATRRGYAATRRRACLAWSRRARRGGLHYRNHSVFALFSATKPAGCGGPRRVRHLRAAGCARGVAAKALDVPRRRWRARSPQPSRLRGAAPRPAPPAGPHASATTLPPPHRLLSRRANAVKLLTV